MRSYKTRSLWSERSKHHNAGCNDDVFPPNPRCHGRGVFSVCYEHVLRGKCILVYVVKRIPLCPANKRFCTDRSIERLLYFGTDWYILLACLVLFSCWRVVIETTAQPDFFFCYLFLLVGFLCGRAQQLVRCPLEPLFFPRNLLSTSVVVSLSSLCMAPQLMRAYTT